MGEHDREEKLPLFLKLSCQISGQTIIPGNFCVCDEELACFLYMNFENLR